MTIVRNSSLRVLAILIVLSLFNASRARAEASFGDAALTVGLATVAGAVLGASTLPFYDESSEHTKNIFYGAAIGAVIGVGVAAYAGVKDGPNYDDAGLLKPRRSLSLNEAPALRLQGESSTATRRPASFSADTTLAWTPVKTIQF